MRRIELLLVVLTLVATSAAHAGWVRDSVLDYEPQGVIFEVSHFLDDGQHGWVTAVKPPYAPGTAVIFRTTDGGETWERFDTPVAGAPAQIDFVDANNGWIGAGETIVHTTDGGLTWEEQDIWTLHAVRDIHFTSPTQGRACTNLGELLRTNDGGATWNKDRITAGALSDIDHWQGAYRVTGIQGLFSWERPGILSATATLRPRVIEPEPERNPHEKPWARVESLDDVLGGGIINCASFHGDQRMWLGVQEGEQALVILTDDAGRTWERVVVPLPFQVIHDIQFVNATTGWLTCTHAPSIWQTTDGGHTWSPQPHQDGWVHGGKVVDLNMLSATMGYAVWVVPGQRSELVCWTNRPMGWFTRDTGIEDSFYRLWFQDASHCWLVKNTSVGWRGTGGWDFEPMTMVNAGGVECMFSNDGTRGWLGGFRKIMRTTNGGASWALQDAPLSSGATMVNGIFFRDNNRGCAVTSAGDILTTENGGADWYQAAPALRSSMDMPAPLRDVAWFNGAWTIVGSRGVYREGLRMVLTPVRVVGTLADQLRSATPVAPVLGWYGESPWRNRGHGLSEPEITRLDHFRVMYTDRNGDEARGVVLVITDPTGATERRHMYPHHDGSFLTGKTYERAYGWVHNGTYRYHFEATDSTGRRATGVATEEQTVYVARPGEPRY